MCIKWIFFLLVPVFRLQSQPFPAQSTEAKLAATRIGPHQFGETFQDWLIAAKFESADAVCRARRKEVRDGFSTPDAQKAMAGVSSEMRASMEASISVEVDEAGKACDFELSKILTGQAGDIVSVQDLNVKESRWKFTNQKLTQLTITLPAYQPAVIEPNVAKEISFLVEAYGPPTTDKMVPYQNAYGARWDCREVIWTMPDGVQIAAGESIRNTDQGPRRGLLIVFTSKNGGNKQPERNPYVR